MIESEPVELNFQYEGEDVKFSFYSDVMDKERIKTRQFYISIDCEKLDVHVKDSTHLSIIYAPDNIVGGISETHSYGEYPKMDIGLLHKVDQHIFTYLMKNEI